MSAPEEYEVGTYIWLLYCQEESDQTTETVIQACVFSKRKDKIDWVCQVSAVLKGMYMLSV
jgi:hypothetical protein